MKSIKLFGSWFYKGKWFWLIIFLIVGPIIILPIIKMEFINVKTFQYLGLGLELVGVSIVAESLNSKLKLFEGYTIRSFLFKYFKEFPFRKKRIFNQTLHVGGFTTSTSFGTARISKRPNENFAEIIKYFEEEFINLRSDIKKLINILTNVYKI